MNKFNDEKNHNSQSKSLLFQKLLMMLYPCSCLFFIAILNYTYIESSGSLSTITGYKRSWLLSQALSLILKAILLTSFRFSQCLFDALWRLEFIIMLVGVQLC